MPTTWPRCCCSTAGRYAAASPRASGERSSAALLGVLLVGLAAHDAEVLVQLDVDLAAVGQGHLDLVVALLVADLRAGDPAATGLGERSPLGALQGVAGDRGVGTLERVLRAAGCRGHSYGAGDGRGEHRPGDDLRGSLHG